MNTVNSKPVLIFRFLAYEGPGYLGDFLTEKNIPWQLVKVDEGAAIPALIQGESSSVSEFESARSVALGYSGMVLMGGPMSVNDDLPWIAPILSLIREAIAHDIPVLGHCLGGQLMSKALGASISKNPIKEIGWVGVEVSNNAVAKNWFGHIETFNAFHWHGETFSLPQGASHLLASAHCHNQAWSIGKHLAFQTHIEMTPAMVEKWCDEGAEEIQQSKHSPAVQTAEAILQTHASDCLALNQVARQVYQQWAQGIVLK